MESMTVRRTPTYHYHPCTGHNIAGRYCRGYLSEDLYNLPHNNTQNQPDPVLPRVQGLAHLHGKVETHYDNPRVIIETKDATGEWVELETNSGRTVDETLPDVLLTHTPTPLEPFEAAQDHQWWTGWQTVSSTSASGDRMGLPTGEYRFHVYGHHYVGTEETYPWTVEPYELTSDPFIVEPAELSISINETNDAFWFLCWDPNGDTDSSTSKDSLWVTIHPWVLK